MAADFPDELLTEILSRVPAKDLWRVKYACKRWFNLISSPYFMQIQSQFSIDNILLISSSYTSSRLQFNELTNLSYPPHLDHLSSEDFAHPHYKLIGFSHGFLCLYLYNHPLNVFRGKYVLYNPITKSFKSVDLPIEGPNRISLGFGYDSKNDDYKIIDIVYLDYAEIRSPPKLFVYSLRSDTWTLVDNFTRECVAFHPPQASRFVDNVIHTVAYNIISSTRVICCFDISTCKYFEIPTPSFALHRMFNVVVMGGSLHVLVDNSELWVMKEYRVNESWTRLFILRNQNQIVRPIGYWRGKNEVLFEKKTKERCNNKALFSFNLENQTFEEVRLDYGFTDAICYKPTLSSLQSSTKKRLQ